MRASESDRGLICPASLFLPHVARDRSESQVRARDFGTLCHYWKETGDTHLPGADPRDVKCLEKKLIHSGIDREELWPPGTGNHEVTFALNLTTLEWLKPSQDVDRDTWKAAFPVAEWLTGTIDWLGPWWVDDLKTGRWPVDPKVSKQLRSYALLPWVRAGRPGKYTIDVTITQWEKYPLAGLPVRTWHQLDAMDLDEHLDAVRWAASHPDTLVSSEEGCMWCDCKPICPLMGDHNERN